ncbi:MAG: UvrD-helicase domain-containing protein [Hyphomicrobiales bacterium]|nr:UvrD-helicase domain-containing protein [Hyphomicrobiales bacterium]
MTSRSSQRAAPPEPAIREGGIAQRALAASGAPYLAALNAEQRHAVETLDGPVLVLAGAGTGKTRVLTTRIAHILRTGRARAHEILAVTFTNKAAHEMRERVIALIGESAQAMPWLGTFHSIGVKILRRHAELVGLRPDFTILDTDDQIRLLKQVIAAENIDEKRWPARQLAAYIDNWKNRGLMPDKVPAGDAFAYANGRGAHLYAAYQERLRTLNAVDFGDLLILCLKLFQEQADVLDSFQKRFRYILVDEYQDTNVAQYLWLRLLAQQGGNICCVGDDDQSIYGWRGAEVDNILRFEHDFPGARVIRLERNYRSTSHILQAASHLIAHNESRLGKTLHTDGEDGEKIAVRGLWDGEEEARAIGEDIEDLQRHGHGLDEIAILVRASFQMREFEDRFVTLGLNYRVIGGPRFYERAEIRDALAYLKLTVNPTNDLAFERIVNTPRRGLGDATLKVLHEHARFAEVPLTTAARTLIETEEVRAAPRRALAALLADFERWRSLVDTLPHVELAEMVLDESGYTEMWQNEKSADAPGRLENLKELVRSMDAFGSLAEFLEHVSLIMDADSATAGDERVNLMTLHAAKGLEFDTVFLPGWEEGLFPHQRALDQSGRAGLEEERRLAYVGLTRARKRARISFAQNRRIHALWQSSIPSRFLDELPEENVEILGRDGSFAGSMGGPYGASRFDSEVAFAGSYETPGWRRARRSMRRGPGAQGPGAQGMPPTIDGELTVREHETVTRFAVGERVFHQKFGYGRIAAIDGNKLTIDFDKADRKRVLDSFVERP